MKSVFIKSICLVSAFILYSTFSFSQSEKHVKIPGTKCSIIPPDGFSAATSFSGFQNETTGASIMINEIPGPYKAIIDGFTADALSERGMTLISKKKIDHNGSKATFITVSQNANGTTYLKQMLIFGNSTTTIIANGIYPEASKSIESQVKDALLSVHYNNALKEDNPEEIANFTVDVIGSDFKLAKFISGNLLYSTDGKIPTEKPTLIVGNSVAKVPAARQRQYAEERVKKLPRGESNVIKEIKEITIDSMSGYEIVAHGKSKDGKTELIYLVLLFNEEGDYFIINGRATENIDKNLTVYKKIAATFKRK